MPDILGSSFFMVYPLALIYAFLSDIKTLTIPNSISVILVLGFFPAAFFADLPLQTVFAHLGVAAGMLVVGFIIFSFNIVGGGDAKLIAAASIWVGWKLVLPFLLLTGILGGVLALAVILIRRLRVGEKLIANTWPLKFISRGVLLGRHLPYGVAIGGAGLILMSKLNTFPFGG